LQVRVSAEKPCFCRESPPVAGKVLPSADIPLRIVAKNPGTSGIKAIAMPAPAYQILAKATADVLNIRAPHGRF
jgi:hypothetical protein